MKTIILLIIVSFFSSCNSIKPTRIKTENFCTKIIDTLDLSNKGLKKIPDLSKCNIKYLNLSNNKIKYYDNDLLPKSLIELNLSHNSLKGFVKVKTSLDRLNLSHNKIDSIIVYECIKDYVDISYNHLKHVEFNCFMEGYTSVLDISNNKNLDNRVHFIIEVFKKIIHNNIKNNEPIIHYHDNFIIVD